MDNELNELCLPTFSNIKELKQSIKIYLVEKYKTNENNYNNNIINDLINKKKSKLVSNYKDNLLLNENIEYLRRYYNTNETIIRLSKICNFYLLNSQIYPNYIKINESKYMFKNIRKKQKLADAFNKNKFFDSEIKRSIFKCQVSYNLNDSISQFDSLEHINENVSMSLNFNKNIIDNDESIICYNKIINSLIKKEKERIKSIPKIEKKVFNKNIIINNTKTKQIKKQINNKFNEKVSTPKITKILHINTNESPVKKQANQFLNIEKKKTPTHKIIASIPEINKKNNKLFIFDNCINNNINKKIIINKQINNSKNNIIKNKNFNNKNKFYQINKTYESSPNKEVLNFSKNNNNNCLILNTCEDIPDNKIISKFNSKKTSIRKRLLSPLADNIQTEGNEREIKQYSKMKKDVILFFYF